MLIERSCTGCNVLCKDGLEDIKFTSVIFMETFRSDSFNKQNMKIRNRIYITIGWTFQMKTTTFIHDATAWCTALWNRGKCVHGDRVFIKSRSFYANALCLSRVSIHVRPFMSRMENMPITAPFFIKMYTFEYRYMIYKIKTYTFYTRQPKKASNLSLPPPPPPPPKKKKKKNRPRSLYLPF